MMKKILGLLLFLSSYPVFCQTAALPIYSCVQQGVKAKVSGLNSTNYMQGIVPSCTVKVYLTGTQTIATTTPQSPFTANTDGSIPPIYAAVNQVYDVVLSGGISPNTYPSPVTISTGSIGATTTYALTASATGGAAPGSTFNGSAAVTFDYHSFGAAPLASPTFTGTVTIPQSLVAGSVSGKISAPAGTHFIFKGDSLTYGYLLSNPDTQSFPALFGGCTLSGTPGTCTTSNTAGGHSFVGPSATIVNLGITGETLVSMLSNYATEVRPYCLAATASVPVYLHFEAGINDIMNSGPSAATVYSGLQTYWSEAKADGCTVTATTLTPAGNLSALQDSTRIAVNEDIRSSVGLYSYLDDLASLLPDPSDVVWYTSDMLHYQLPATSKTADFINALWTAQNGFQPAEIIQGGIFSSRLVVSDYTVQPSDRILYSECSSCTVTLANPTTTGQVVVIENWSGGVLTVTSVANNLPFTRSLAPQESLTLLSYAPDTWNIIKQTPYINPPAVTSVDQNFSATSTIPNSGSLSPGFNLLNGAGYSYGSALANWAGSFYVDNYIPSNGAGWHWCEYASGTPLAATSQETYCHTLSNPTANDSFVMSTQMPLTGTSSSIGGSSLAAGACASTTVSITGATTSNAVEATPATYPGDAYYWKGYVSATGTVTVKVCAAAAGTPTASTYSVRVIQ
jgi:hypothetical protein